MAGSGISCSNSVPRPATNAINSFEKREIGSAELEFEEGIKTLKEEDVAGRSASLAVTDDRAAFFAVRDPRAAIIQAWLGVEQAAYRLADRHNLLVGGGARSPGHIFRLLHEAQAIDSRQLVLLTELRALRNEAVHNVDFAASIDSVLSYIQFADGLKQELERAARDRQRSEHAR